MPLGSVKKRGKLRAPVGSDGVSAPTVVGPIVHDKLPPMPDPDVLDRQLVGVLEGMNIPKGKHAEMLNQAPEKKWQLVWGQMKSKARHPPEYYVEAMAQHMEVILKSKKKPSKSRPKLPADLEPASNVLRGLEISLRTNALAWVKEFLHYQPPQEKKKSGSETNMFEHGGLDVLMEYFENMDEFAMEDTNDYLCVLCLRALMNNAYGFQSVMAHPGTIDAIVLCLGNVNPFSSTLEQEQLVRKYRTHILVLELLAAVCLVPKGHQRVLSAFNNYTQVKNEKVRFQTLMHLLRSERHNIAVVVACMAFINVVVHCVPDMNYQVALQHEFTQLGILPLLEELRKTSAADLTEQIEAYKDNFLNVAELAREAELRQEDLEAIEELEGNINAYRAKIAEDETKFKQAVASLNHEVADSKSLVESLRSRLDAEKVARTTDRQTYDNEMTVLKQDVASAVESSQRTLAELEKAGGERDALQERAMQLEAEIIRMQTAGPMDAQFRRNMSSPMKPLEERKESVASAGALPDGYGFASEPAAPAAAPAPPPPAPAPPPPPPPPPPAPPSAGGAPPPAPDLAGGASAAGPVKRRIELDVKLPMLNWATLPHHKIAGTVFKELDDDAVVEEVDFSDFKKAFTLGGRASVDKGSATPLAKKGSAEWKMNMQKGPMSVLPPNKARNLVISQRRLGKDMATVIQAIERLDFESLPTEQAELLRDEFVVDDDELKDLNKQHSSGKKMAPIDEFLLQLSAVPRLKPKLTLVIYLGSSEDLLDSVVPQMDSLIAASNSLLSSERLRKLMEIILAFGNYMNSQRRGGVFGFKLSAFDRLVDTKSKVKDESLMNYICKVVQRTYPHVDKFTEDLAPLDSACSVSLATLEGDIATLKRTVDAVAEERKSTPDHPRLTAFVETHQPRVESAVRDLADAKEIYNKATRFFGETGGDPSSFFGIFNRLVKAYNEAKAQNAERKKKELEAAERAKAASNKGSSVSLSLKGSHVRETATEGAGHRYGGRREEVADGAIDEIISEIKANAFRTPAVQMKREKREIGSHDEFTSYASARPWLK